jgi:hypothetical protein
MRPLWALASQRRSSASHRPRQAPAALPAPATDPRHRHGHRQTAKSIRRPQIPATQNQKANRRQPRENKVITGWTGSRA